MSDAHGNTAHELYHTGLRNQHAVENQAIELLERQVGRVDDFPEMKARIQRHIEESRVQAQRLDQILERHGTSASAMKDGMMSFMGNMAALAHTPAADEVIKNTIANFAFEHFEIAAYKSLIALGEQIGDAEGVRLLTTSLQEEEAMAEWIDTHIAPTTLKFAAMKAAASSPRLEARASRRPVRGPFLWAAGYFGMTVGLPPGAPGGAMTGMRLGVVGWITGMRLTLGGGAMMPVELP